MIYELRDYEAMPGKLAPLSQRFGDHTVGFFQRHGIGMLGFWTPEVGVSNRLVYILTFDDLADREKKWGAFQADQDWARVRRETDTGGPMVARIRNSIMRTTPYSPEPKIRSKVQELRIYETVPGKLPALNDRFANHTISLGDREKSFGSFGADPEWQKVRSESEANGALVERISATILRPTAYSPR